MTPQETINKLNSLKQYYNDKNEDGYVGFDNEDNEAITMAIQALEQQPRMGEWRHYERTITCSECNTEFYDDIMEYCGDDVPRFCLHCGARMNGGGEE